MIISMDDSAIEEGLLIAGRDASLTGQPPEKCSKYSDKTALTDASITFIGHTDDTRATVGGEKPKQMAAKIAQRYGKHQSSLKEVFLVACESGTRSTQENWLWGSTISPSFAQQLAEEMAEVGFTDIKVYSAKPPEGAHAMRVTITKNFGPFVGGTVGAIAYMNEYTTNFEDSQGTDAPIKVKNPTHREQHKVVKIMEPKSSHQETFKAACEACVPKGTRRQESNPPLETRDYLGKLLENKGVLQRLFYAIFGAPVITNLMAEQLRLMKEKEEPALHALRQLNEEISLDVQNKINTPLAAVNRFAVFFTTQKAPQTKGTALSHYLNLPQNTLWEERDKAWQTLQPHADKFVEDKKLGKRSYQSIYAEINAEHTKLAQINEEKNGIKKQLVDIIDYYLDTHRDAADPMHQAKRRVMETIKTYVNDPTPSNWTAIKEATSADNEANKGWDEGYFSRVQDIKEQTEIFHAEREKPIPRPR